MKATLDLPDDLLKAMKLRAVHEGKKLKDVAAEAIRRGLSMPDASASGSLRQRVKLPIIQCRHAAAPGQELTPERVAELLENEETQWANEAAGR